MQVTKILLNQFQDQPAYYLESSADTPEMVELLEKFYPKNRGGYGFNYWQVWKDSMGNYRAIRMTWESGCIYGRDFQEFEKKFIKYHEFI